MSRGVYVRGVSVQEGICPGVSVWGVHVRGVSDQGVCVLWGIIKCPGGKFPRDK